jgi:hypothetical protein
MIMYNTLIGVSADAALILVPRYWATVRGERVPLRASCVTLCRRTGSSAEPRTQRNTQQPSKSANARGGPLDETTALRAAISYAK